MSLRSLTREPTDFVVKFVTDGSVMVRQRQHLLTDEKIKVNEIYSVKWGSTVTACSDAVVLASGSYIDMSAIARVERAKGNQLAPNTPPSMSPTPSSRSQTPSPRSQTPSPRSPTPPPSKRQQSKPAAARKIGSPRLPPSRAKLTRSGKPAAKVLLVVSPAKSPARASPQANAPPVITPRVTAPSATVTSATAQPARASPVFQISRPSPVGNQSGQLHSALASIGAAITRLQKSSDARDKKVDGAIDRIGEIERQITRVEAKLDRLLTRPVDQPPIQHQDDEGVGLDGVPDMYQVSMTDLKAIEGRTKGPGNMASHLTKRLFPELFGIDNLRFFYNWFGGGKHGKRELDPARKAVIKKYTSQFFPGVRLDDSWRNSVVPKVNELLRRPVEKKKPTQPAQVASPVHDEYELPEPYEYDFTEL